ncbi:hypothetical protein SDC9_122206 [bioreactor metagenome]|uniref:Uncharacterized protein n=1 Tax=bioreactor metagenome TaxID=1076179 RepID=A0A645CE88_9ZZZZ
MKKAYNFAILNRKNLKVITTPCVQNELLSFYLRTVSNYKDTKKKPP